MNNKLKGLVCLLFVLLVLAQAGKMFVLDEIDFPLAAKAISETSRPIYYRGEESPNRLGTYHPTLYMNALALFIMTFGFSENVVRGFGLTCTLLTTSLAIATYRQLVRDSTKRRLFATVFMSLFLLHPYTIANTTLPDIDSTVLPVVMAGYICALTRTCTVSRSSEGGVCHLQLRRSVPWLAALFALCLWAKLTTPLILVPFTFLGFALYGVPIRKALGCALIIGVLGLALFVLTYWVYCTLLSLPFGYTFRFLTASFSKGTAGTASIFSMIGQNLSYARYFMSWLTLPALTLFGASAYYLLWGPAFAERRVIIAFAGLGVFVTIFYLGLIPPFSGFFKYPFPTFFLLMFSMAAVATEITQRISPREGLLSALLALAVGVAYTRAFSDESIARSVAPAASLAAVCVSGAAGYCMTRWRGKAFSRRLTLGLLACSIGVGLAISRSQAIAPYPTKYYYRQTGLEETVAYLKGKVEPGEVIWSMKDVGYYVNNRYIENYMFFFERARQSQLRDLLTEGNVRYYVATVGIGEDRVDAYPEIRKILESYAFKERVFGNYVVYRARRR